MKSRLVVLVVLLTTVLLSAGAVTAPTYASARSDWTPLMDFKKAKVQACLSSFTSTDGDAGYELLVRVDARKATKKLKVAVQLQTPAAPIWTGKVYETVRPGRVSRPTSSGGINASVVASTKFKVTIKTLAGTKKVSSGIFSEVPAC
ncbi:hypothetical protein L2K70_13645 [Nocardioides KLBMP 9356]|uniref:Uncharacterized protein n=1 Tax=Nocardioides potassii TaxID=2911371 RepID=A0ABS9HEW2_9ACTN|nr:hypothetical protein [Nocardioides potassii]MCF6378651.1 hypothetical protein [Nocardioides potassii]